jgi:hypothetical protein
MKVGEGTLSVGGWNEIIMAAGEQFCSEPPTGAALAELTLLVEFMEACNESGL